jgi:hypothetical protein
MPSPRVLLKSRALLRRAAGMALWLLWSASSHALDVQYSNPFPDGPLAGVARGLRLSGQVLPGDAARLVEVFRRKPADAWFALGRVEVAISGGDQGEALQLAETLAALYPYVVSTADCAGPCAIVWLAGAWRLAPRGRIGLQKPPASQPAIRTPAASDAPPAFDTLAARLAAYYPRQGLPLALQQRWESGGEQILWLSESDLNLTGTWPPYYFDKLHSKCPRLAATDESFHALRRCAARLVISQKAFALDALLAGVNDPWWNDNKELFLRAPR